LIPEVCIEIFFTIDICKYLKIDTYYIVMNFNTGYYDKGVLIMDRKLISRRYI